MAGGNSLRSKLPGIKVIEGLLVSGRKFRRGVWAFFLKLYT